MKKVLLSLLAIATATAMSAQVADCNPNDYNFGDEPFGVSPDPAMDESFEVGVVGEAYIDVIYIKIPTDASEIEIDGVDLPPGIMIDSIALESVTFQLAGTLYSLGDMGLEIQCNNLGFSGNPCTFGGGSQNCATISGVPTTPGVFNLSINVVGYVTIFGNVTGIPVEFDQYTFEVTGEVATVNQEAFVMSLGQNFPNPATGYTRVPLTLERAGNVNFTVVNLLGETVVRDQIAGHVGYNEFVFDATMLNAGIYLYSIDVDGKRITKRMIVNR